ncbi:MAG: hypothetical protein M1832_002594 [Thelocarpon impressellum]|nr:MAG: hypothetical protein M1832_002594 [Thelocarpon impressellum]
MDDASSSPPTPPPSASKKRKREGKPIAELEVDMSAPEPPSKKALRKAKKGKAVKPAASKISGSPVTHGGPESSLDEDATASGPKEEKRSPHGIWIGNLPFTATKAELRKFLTENSSITEEQITRLHLPGPSSKDPATAAAARQKVKPQNKGFAYLDFSTERALDEALGLSEALLSGRRVLIKNSKSFEGRPDKPKDEVTAAAAAAAGSRMAKPPSKRVFVGNLGFEATEEDIRDHFGKCGEVAHIHVATFEDSGKCKGYAWVEFDDVEAAQAAVRGWTKGVFEATPDGDADDACGSGEEGSETEQGERKKTKKKAKERKWWVNRMRGRPLRMEFAEDKAVRYKKRFGKEPSARDGGGQADGSGHAGAPTHGHARVQHEAAPTQQPRQVGGSHEKVKSRPTQRRVDARTIKPGAALANAPRLTGAIVESKGRKTTFD